MNVMLMSHINPKQTRTYWLTVERDTSTHTYARTYVRIYEKKYYYTEKQELCGTNATAKTIQPNSMEFRFKCLNYGNVFVSIPIE